jgi:predicted tellurium resistance membrane protein TerC
MSLILIVLLVGFLGFGAYMVSTAPSIHPWFKTLAIGLLVFIAILLILQGFGLLPSGLHIR